MASSKVETCLKKNKRIPSANIPLLSYRKSEQLGDTKLHTNSQNPNKTACIRAKP